MIADKFLMAGVILIFVGIIFLIVSSIILAVQPQQNKTKETESKVEIGAGGFIGPIPFGFFTSKKVFWMWMVLVVMALIVWVAVRKIGS